MPSPSILGRIRPALRLTITRRIWVLIALTVITFALASSFALFGLKRVQASVDELARDAFPRVTEVTALRDTYQTMQLTVFEMAATSDKDKAEAIGKRVEALQEKVYKAVGEYDKRAIGEVDKKLMDEAKVSLSPYLTKLEQVKSLSKMGEPMMAFGVLDRGLVPLHKALSASLDQVVEYNRAHADKVAEQAERAYRATVTAVVIAAVAGIAVIGLVGFFLGRSITRPMSAMQKAITRTAQELDFTSSIPVKGGDEIGLTLSAYNRLLERLRASLSEIQGNARALQASSSEIDQTAQAIADNSTTESDAAASMAAAIQQMTVSVSVIAGRAQDAAQFTQTSGQTADRGAQVILSTVQGIEAISTSVEQASARITALRASSENISAVAQMIREIAEQTNLLALNAAIEAARAGEQGRGFAVVADEVRKLAERTAKSTQQIESLIDTMQAGANDAVATMHAAVEEVKRGQASAVTAGEAIREIQQGSKEVAAAVDEITVAIREQASTSTAIAQQVEQIARMSEENSAAASSSAQSVRHMHALTQGIADAVAKYKV